MLKYLLLIGGLLLGGQRCQAQHPVDIQRMTAEGDYYKALVAFSELPKRRITTETILAVAKSAWGLSLPKQAIGYFESALRDQTLSETEKARINLARGILEYQEERYQVAAVYAERAVGLLADQSPLRGRSYQLWADSLVRLNSLALAEQKYSQAIVELEAEALPEAYFYLGLCQHKLGKHDDARLAFEQVPLNHFLAADAVRQLVIVAIEMQRYQQAQFWLNTGREHFSDSFIDSWVDYQEIKVAIQLADSNRLNELLQRAEERYPPSDYWLTLAQGAVVAYQWKQLSRQVTVKDDNEKSASQRN